MILLAISLIDKNSKFYYEVKDTEARDWSRVKNAARKVLPGKKRFPDSCFAMHWENMSVLMNPKSEAESATGKPPIIFCDKYYKNYNLHAAE